MRIGLCTPCYDGTVHHQHMLSVIATMKMAARKGVQINHYTAPGCPVLPRVRNRLVASAMADKCDWIMFVDDDIAWTANDFFKLFEHGVSMVAAAPPKRHRRWDEAPAPVLKHTSGNELQERRTPAGRIWKVDGCAAGFLAIHASVITNLEGVTVPFVSDGDPQFYQTRNWFWHDIINVNGVPMDEGEDYNFCRKWRETGGECWVDPDIRVGHYSGNVCHDICLADTETEEAA